MDGVGVKAMQSLSCCSSCPWAVCLPHDTLQIQKHHRPDTVREVRLGVTWTQKQICVRQIAAIYRKGSVPLSWILSRRTWGQNKHNLLRGALILLPTSSFVWDMTSLQTERWHFRWVAPPSVVPFHKEDEFHFACSCREGADSVDKMLLRRECSAQSCTEPVKEMRPGKKGELTVSAC